MYSSDDREFMMTYSEEERYSNYVFKIQERNRAKEERRKYYFKKLAEEQEHTIFNFQGLNIMKFTERKIKFCYQPSLLYEYISKKLIFYCSLKYLPRYKKWMICREPMPARPLFLKVTSGAILIPDNLEEIITVILRVYRELRRWSENEIRYRRKKYERYRAGQLGYLDIDSADEELYFSENERQALFEKRQAVLRRMIPPPRTATRLQLPKPTRIKYII